MREQRFACLRWLEKWKKHIVDLMVVYHGLPRSKVKNHIKPTSSLTYNHMDTAFDCSRYRKHLSGIAFLWGHTCFHTGLENPQPHPPDWNICWRINLFIDLKSEETSKKPMGNSNNSTKPPGSVNFTHWHSTSGNPTGSMFQLPNLPLLRWLKNRPWSWANSYQHLPTKCFNSWPTQLGFLVGYH